MTQSDDEQIRNLLARYCHLIDDGQFEEWSRLFTADGTFAVSSGASYHGHEGILGYVVNARQNREANRHSRHICTNSEITVDGDVASVASDLLLLSKLGDAPWGIRLVARYADVLVRQEDTWRFKERRLLV